MIAVTHVAGWSRADAEYLDLVAAAIRPLKRWRPSEFATERVRLTRKMDAEIEGPFQVDHLREIVVRCLESKGLLRMTEDALREALGAAIRERRKALGFTLSNMSERTGVSLGYLSQIELGKNSASIETLYRICLALGMKMSDLFTAIQRC